MGRLLALSIAYCLPGVPFNVRRKPPLVIMPWRSFGRTINSADWLVAEHYCYLGDADGDLMERVINESLFGSLLGRLAEASPELVHEQRPRFAADEDALMEAVKRAVSGNDPGNALFDSSGYARAYGLRYAALLGYDAAVRIDADGQHRAGDISRVVDPMRRCAT